MNWLINAMDPTIINALGKMILHSLWQASLIAFLLSIALKVIPQKSAHLRHELSALALFTIFIVSLCTFILNLQTSEILVVAEQSTFSNGDVVLEAAPSAINHSTLFYTVTFWILGFLLLTFRLLFSYLNLYKLKSRWKVSRNPVILIHLGRLQKKLGLTRKIKLVESALIDIPGTIGYLKPIILMPLSSATQLSPEQLEAVLAHEVAHIKRADFILNIFYNIIETIFYYHPAIWWISEQIEHERESACDDLAIKLTGNKINYLNTLYTLKNNSIKSRLAMNILGGRSSFEKRFNRQLTTPEKNTKTMEKISIISFLLLALIGLSFRNADKNKTEIKTTSALELVLLQDTVPGKKSKSRSKINTSFDGHQYEILKENGELIYFKEDGVKIPSEQFEQYADVMEKLQEMMDNVPSPPTPPTPPNPDMAPTPPSPPSAPTPRSPVKNLEPVQPVSPPAPPAPPTPLAPDTPPAPPAPPRNEEIEMQLRDEMLAKAEMMRQDALRLQEFQKMQDDHLRELEVTMEALQRELEEVNRMSEIDFKQQQVEMLAAAEHLKKEQKMMTEEQKKLWEDYEIQMKNEFAEQKEAMEKMAEEARRMAEDEDLHFEHLNLEERKRILQDQMKAIKRDLEMGMEAAKKDADPIRNE